MGHPDRKFGLVSFKPVPEIPTFAALLAVAGEGARPTLALPLLLVGSDVDVRALDAGVAGEIQRAYY
jgi:hypothetical protein